MGGIAIAPRIEGVGSVSVDPEGRISAGGPGDGIVPNFDTLPNPVNTTSNAPTLFWTVPFTLSEASDLWIVLNGSSIAVPQVAAQVFIGAAFSADVDGAPAIGLPFYELDIGPFATSQVGSFAGNLSLQFAVLGLAAGAHTAHFFWQTVALLAGQVRLDMAAGDANVHIGRL